MKANLLENQIWSDGKYVYVGVKTNEMTTIKEICGFEDSKGRFHHTKEGVEKANIQYHKDRVFDDFLNELGDKQKVYHFYSYEVKDLVRNFLEHTEFWNNFSKAYNGEEGPLLLGPTKVKLNKKKWWQW